MSPAPRRPKIVTIRVPNPQTGRDVKVTFEDQGKSEGEEWYGVRAADVQEAGTLAPKGLISASQLVFDHDEYGNMHEPMSFVARGGGAGLVLYLAAAIFAKRRGRRGIRASDTLSHYSIRLWDKMVEHGLAQRGGAMAPYASLNADDVEAWIARHRKEHP